LSGEQNELPGARFTGKIASQQFVFYGGAVAKQYRVNLMVKLINLITSSLARLGLGPRQYHLLTVRGRASGKPYSTTVSLVIDKDQSWLVAPYGEVGWVRNARAAGEVTLSRGRRSQQVRINQVDARAAAPILKRYIAMEPITRPYFVAGPRASLAEFEAEADRHPVFRVEAA
jgi:deazaflavin-dependent oxidoreductase (nitroreductase family)